MLLSVIIPVYNLENYISNCIQSILDQDLDKNLYEILIIDDGSTDKTLDIVKTFEKNNTNITVYCQKNLGKGVALKNGLKYAEGKYLYFFDGDDYLAKDCLLKLVTTSETYDLDLLGFDVLVTKRLDHYKSRIAPQDNYVPKIQSGIDFLGSCPYYRVEVWWYIIKRSFFYKTGLTFEDRRFVNDSYFTPSLFCKAERVSFMPLDVYRYVQRPNSITSSKSPTHYQKHIEDTVYAIHKMRDIITNLPKEAAQAKKTILVKQESYVFFSIVRFMKSDLELNFLKALLKDYKDIEAYTIKAMGKDEKYRAAIFRILIIIFNRPNLLYPTVNIARVFFKLKNSTQKMI